MSTAKPSPQTWTLRFKHHRTTILLHVDPLQKLTNIKSALLSAIQQTHPSGTFNNLPIPRKYGDILLAKPVDINDLSAGWQRLPDGEDSGKGKQKVAPTSSVVSKVKGKDVPRDCPQGVGLRDGGIVAFRFRMEEDGVWEKAEEEGDVMVVEEDEGRGEVWDVVVPTLEETYGEGLPGEVVDLDDT